MRYQVIIKPAAVKELDRLPKAVRIRVLEALERLGANPRPAGVVKIAGAENLWRIRVGTYRVIYEIVEDRLIVLVLRVAHRKDVYRGT